MKIAHWAYFDADPSQRPPFNIRIGTTDDLKLGELNIEDCADIPAGAQQVMDLLKSEQVARTQRFYFIYPRYAVEEDSENTMHYIAGLVLDESTKHGVQFAREISRPLDADFDNLVLPTAP